MNVPKDVYLEIVSKMTDRDVLNMLSVNKKYNNPEFFRQILFKRYPLLVAYRKLIYSDKQNIETQQTQTQTIENIETESWKSLYLRMVKYIYLLKEKYNINYIQAMGFNPKRVYYDLENFADTFWQSKAEYINDIIFYYIGESGKSLENLENLERKLVNLEKNNILGINGDYYLRGLAKNGNLELLQKYKYDIEELLEYMMESKNPEIVELADKYYTDDPLYIINKFHGALASDNLSLATKYIKIYMQNNGNNNNENNENNDNDINLLDALNAGNIAIFEFALENVKNFDIIPKDDKYFRFIKDERLDWTIFFVNFLKNKKIPNYNLMIKILKNLANKYFATDILNYLNSL